MALQALINENILRLQDEMRTDVRWSRRLVSQLAVSRALSKELEEYMKKESGNWKKDRED